MPSAAFGHAEEGDTESALRGLPLRLVLLLLVLLLLLLLLVLLLLVLLLLLLWMLMLLRVLLLRRLLLLLLSGSHGRITPRVPGLRNCHQQAPTLDRRQRLRNGVEIFRYQDLQVVQVRHPQ